MLGQKHPLKGRRRRSSNEATLVDRYRVKQHTVFPLSGRSNHTKRILRLTPTANLCRPALQLYNSNTNNGQWLVIWEFKAVAVRVSVTLLVIWESKAVAPRLHGLHQSHRALPQKSDAHQYFLLVR